MFFIVEEIMFVFVLFLVLLVGVFADCPCGSACDCDSNSCPVEIADGEHKIFIFGRHDYVYIDVTFESNHLLNITGCLRQDLFPYPDECAHITHGDEGTTCVKFTDDLVVNWNVAYIVACRSGDGSVCSVTYQTVDVVV